MKKTIKTLILTLYIFLFGLSALAGDQEEALKFFHSYVNASNNYSISILSMYSNNAKIIREIIKPDSSLVDVPFPVNDYKHQLKLSSKLAKLRNYKNNYSNIKVTKVANGYRIDSIRKPSLSDDKLKSTTVVQKQPDGKWLIIEEKTQTKEQIFLKYAK